MYLYHPSSVEQLEKNLEDALSEARFLHMENDVKREIGPDGSWIDDVLSPEDMVTLIFERSIA